METGQTLFDAVAVVGDVLVVVGTSSASAAATQAS